MKYYSALKRNQILIHATTWVKLKNMPSKISQTQRITIVDSASVTYIEWENWYRQKVE